MIMTIKRIAKQLYYTWPNFSMQNLRHARSQTENAAVRLPQATNKKEPAVGPAPAFMQKRYQKARLIA